MPKMPSQRSVTDQLQDLVVIANREGLYDVADRIQAVLLRPEDRLPRTWYVKRQEAIQVADELTLKKWQTHRAVRASKGGQLWRIKNVVTQQIVNSNGEPFAPSGTMTQTRFSKASVAAVLQRRIDVLQTDWGFDPSNGWAQVLSVAKDCKFPTESIPVAYVAYGEYLELISLAASLELEVRPVPEDFVVKKLGKGVIRYVKAP